MSDHFEKSSTNLHVSSYFVQSCIQLLLIEGVGYIKKNGHRKKSENNWQKISFFCRGFEVTATCVYLSSNLSKISLFQSFKSE